jgi:hypothetical protein
LFCSPVEGSEYRIGQIVNLSWNPSNPILAIETEVEVYLIRKQQGIENVVPLNSTVYLSVPREMNSQDFNVLPEWLPNLNSSIPNENGRHTFLFRVIPKGHDDNPDAYNSFNFIVIGMFLFVEDLIYKFI